MNSRNLRKMAKSLKMTGNIMKKKFFVLAAVLSVGIGGCGLAVPETVSARPFVPLAGDIPGGAVARGRRAVLCLRLHRLGRTGSLD